MKSSLKYIASAAFGLSIVLFIAACGKDDAASPTSGRLRLFNAVADVPTTGNVDVLVDGVAVNLRNWLTGGTPLVDSTFKYGAGFPANGDSSYLYLTEGAHNIKINVTGATTGTLSQDVTIAAGKTSTAFVIDSLAKMGILIVQDVLPTTKQGRAFIRIAQLSPNSPATDAMVRYVKTVSGVATYPDSISAATNLAYKGVSDFIEVKAPDSLIVEFRNAGTTRAAVTFAKTALVAGRCYTIISRGYVGRTSPQNLATSSVIQGR